MNAGFTLLELIAVLAIVGLMASLSMVALGSLARPEDPVARARREARATAIRDGIPVVSHGLRFLPDGRVIGPEASHGE